MFAYLLLCRKDSSKNHQLLGCEIAFEGADVVDETHSEFYDAHIEVFPNPATDIVEIRGDFSNANVQLRHSSGQILRAYTNVNAPLIIDMEDLPSGSMYILIESEFYNRVQLKKLLKL